MKSDCCKADVSRRLSSYDYDPPIFKCGKCGRRCKRVPTVDDLLPSDLEEIVREALKPLMPEEK